MLQCIGNASQHALACAAQVARVRADAERARDCAAARDATAAARGAEACAAQAPGKRADMERA